MKKTINVNLGGLVYTIDDDAYALLSNYLDTLRTAFEKSEYDNELIEDVESRIAEIFAADTDSGKRVVTFAMAANVIEQMGSPEEIVGVEETVNPANDETSETVFEQTVPPPYTPEEKIPHRLYRDSRSKKLGGVCAGFASYLKWDVTLVRLIVIALFFLSASTVFIVYVVLWIAMPLAKTPLQFMELDGESPTLSNIGKTVTNAFKSNPNAKDSQQRSGWMTFADGLISIASTLFKAAIIVLGVISVPVLFALIIGIMACVISFFAIPFGFDTSMITEMFDIPILPVMHTEIFLIFAIAAFIAVAIPLFLFLMWLLFWRGKDKSLGKGWGTALGIIWGIAVAITICGEIVFKVFR